MADPFVAEIRMFGFNFAPTGWRSVTDRYSPSRRTRPSSRCSAPSTEATVKAPSLCLIWRGASPSIRDRGRDSANTTSGPWAALNSPPSSSPRYRFAPALLAGQQLAGDA